MVAGEDAAAANIYFFHSRQLVEAAIKIAAYGHPAGLQNHAFRAVRRWAQYPAALQNHTFREVRLMSLAGSSAGCLAPGTLRGKLLG